jgi:hypothetical protein
VFVWHLPSLHVPFAAALLAAKPRGLRPVGFDLKRLSTNFTVLGNQRFDLGR